jgi:hypothetical protein
MLEQELKKIYRFFVQQERELYLQINTRLHIRTKYETFSLAQLEKELEELQTLSSYATSLSCYIYLNITGMAKILKKFDKKFKRYNLKFSQNFIVEKYQKKNSDLLYIHQYKILDEVGACVEQLKNELQEKFNYLVKNPIKEINNARLNALNQKIKSEQSINAEEGLLDPDNKEGEGNNNALPSDSIEKIKNKFASLNTSISNMEAFYHSISLVFEVWMRYIKANEYKSHIYTVKSAKEIYDTNSINNENNEEKNELAVKDKKPEHFLSQESYLNIRLILVQAFIMSVCSTYFYPTIYYLLKSSEFSPIGDKEMREKRGLYCGLIISMTHIGGLISISYSNFMINKTYKLLMLSSSVLSSIGNLLFIFGIYYSSIFLICFGTLVTGFSLNTSVHRQYLLYFIPKRKINKYLLYFKLTVLFGDSAGPLLCLFSLLIFPDEYLKVSFNRVFNEYTFPSWICLLASLILLAVIYILFSEPLDPTFIVYAKGQDPKETMKRADSFTLDDSLTIFASEQLNEINQKVSLFNDENQFDDTNLVSSTINELIDVEIEPHGTVRKAYWVIMFYLFILSFTIISYITMAPAYLYVNIYNDNPNVLKPKAQKIISLLFFFSLFLFIPAFCLNFFYISLRINKILYIKVIALVLLSLELLTTAFVVQSQFPFLYYFSFLFTILLAYIMEDELFYFYTQIIPANFELMKIKGITGLYIMRYLGKIFGSLSSLIGISLYSKGDVNYNKKSNSTTNDYEEYLIIIQNSFSIFIQFIILVVFFINSNTFSDRPIRRLVYSKNVREIKRTEF